MFPSARPPARSTTDGQDVRLVANLALDAAASLAAGDHVDQRRQTSAGGRQDAAGDEGLAFIATQSHIFLNLLYHFC
jgi:hypothetical protein